MVGARVEQWDETTDARALPSSRMRTARAWDHQTASLEARFNCGYAGHPMVPHGRIGISAHGTLKRSDFGMALGTRPEGSTMGVGDKVSFAIEAEFNGHRFSSRANAQQKGRGVFPRPSRFTKSAAIPRRSPSSRTEQEIVLGETVDAQQGERVEVGRSASCCAKIDDHAPANDGDEIIGSVESAVARAVEIRPA